MIEVSTDFDREIIQVDLQSDYTKETLRLELCPEKALFLSQLLIEKSLNLIERRK